MTEIPTVKEALSYASGYESGLRDAKEQDVANLIRERDALVFDLAIANGKIRRAYALKEETRKVLTAGRALSNSAYNLSQNDILDERYRLSLKASYEAWDAAARALADKLGREG